MMSNCFTCGHAEDHHMETADRICMSPDNCEGFEPTPNQTPQSTFEEKLREILDYTRFEQEWAAMDLKDHEPTTKHEKTCGVCVKMRVLEDQAVAAITSLVLEALPEMKDPQTITVQDQEYAESRGYNKVLTDIRSIITKESL